MADSNPPEEAPPSYAQATGSSHASSSLHPSSAAGRSSRKERNGIPVNARRSIEDETRPLPEGWVRSFDPQHKHQFFVDIKQDPPRSIWHHPYDDEAYLNTLSSKEREAIQEQTRKMRDSASDYASTDDEAGPSSGDLKQSGKAQANLPPRPGSNSAGSSRPVEEQGKASFGRRWKDRVTGTTHEEREEARRKRYEQEQQAYALHQAFRSAMARAIQTGQPEFVTRGPQGRDIYVEPPGGARPPAGSRGVNPYTQGPYTNPNARFIRPDQVYGRPYGGGYGGGLAGPLAAGGLAGAAGGLLLGGLLF